MSMLPLSSKTTHTACKFAQLAERNKHKHKLEHNAAALRFFGPQAARTRG